ncbi:MAG: BspA family leucine-rich repeat surface protein [Clostridia bacterium]|nr:BspA family leucine-rich repeat surface protein [Clostridia bacterium]
MDFRNFTKGVKNSFSAILTKKIKTSKSSFGLKVLYSGILSLFLCLVLITGYNFLNINNDRESKLSYADDNIVIYTDKDGNEYKLLGDDGDRAVVRRWDLTSNSETATPCAFEAILYKDGMVVLRGTGTRGNIDYPTWKYGYGSITSNKVATAIEGFKPDTCEKLFYNTGNFESFDLSTLNTTGITNFDNMFTNACSDITNDVVLDLTNLDFTSATSISQIFYQSGFSEIKFGSKCIFINCESMYQMFECSKNLKKLDLSSFDTSNVTDASCMFEGCINLKEIIFGSNCTFENCTNFKKMFYLDHSLEELNIQMFDTANVYNWSSFVEECFSLKEINVGEKFTTKNLPYTNGTSTNKTNLSWMFTQCFELKNDITNIIDDTSNAFNLSNMFYCDFNSVEIDLRKFDLSNVTNVSYFFSTSDSSAINNYKDIYGVEPPEDAYKIIYLPSKVNDTSRNITLLGNNYRLVDTDGTILIDNVTSFDPCYDEFGLPIYPNAFLMADDTPPLYKGDTDNDGTEEEYYILGSSDIHVVKRWDLATGEEISTPTNFEVILYDDKTLVYRGEGTPIASSDESNFNFKFSIDDVNKIVTATQGFKPTSCHNLFCHISATSYDLDTINTEGVTDFSGMFSCAGKYYSNKDLMTDIDLTNLDTRSCENAYEMFVSSNFNTITFGQKCTFANCTNMSKMFYQTYAKTINTEVFNTPLLEDISYMFKWCYRLETINLSNFNTKKVTNIQQSFLQNITNNLQTITFGPNCTFERCTDFSSMFEGSEKLRSLNLQYFNTSNVVKATKMFYNCKALSEITFGQNCTFSQCKDFSSMFYGCISLESLDLQNFNTKLTTSAYCMFHQCEKLNEITFGSNCTFENCDNFRYMFNKNRLLETLDIQMFDTRKASLMNTMFQGCWNLKNINVGSKFTTSNVTDLSWMFCECFSLENDLTKIIDDTSKATNVKGMLDSTFNSSIVDLRKFDLSMIASASTNYDKFFNNDGSETSGGILNYKNKFGVNPPDISAKVIYLPSKVNNNSKLINLLGTNAYKLVDKYGRTLVSDVDSFSPCYKADGTLIDNAYALVSDGGLDLMDHILYEEDTDNNGTIDKEYWLLGTDSLKVKARWNLFKPEKSTGELITKPGKCEVILYEDGTLIYRGYDPSYKQQSVYVLPDWAKEYDGVVPTRIRMAYEGFKVNNMYYFFDGFKTITDIDLTNIDISDCSDFRYVFYGCRNLSKLNLSSLVFTKANPMFGGIFAGTEVIETIDISNFPAGSASAGMFKDSRVENIILPDGFINSSTTNINEFFEYNNIYSGKPPRLESINFSTCDFSGLTTYSENWTNSNIFKGSDTLKEIYIPLKNATIDIPLPQGTTNGYWQCLKEDGSLVSEQMYQTLQSKEEIPEAVKMVPAFCFASTIETDLEDVTSANQLLFTVKFNNTKPIKNAPDSVYDAIKVSADSDEIPKTDYSITQEDANTIDEHYNVALQKSKVLSLNKSGSKVLKVEIANDTLEDVDGVKVVGTVKQITVTNTVPDDPKPITPDKPSITTNTITVQTIAHESYIDGYNDKTFKPNNNMTRAEFSKIIASISNNYSDSISNLSYNKKYQDMKDDNKWYSNYVGYVTKENLMQGDEKGFRPNDYITRAEVSRVLKNLFKINTMSNKEKETLNKFGNELNNKWYKDDMVSLITNGIMNGYPDGTVKPTNNITRAEIVSLVNKLKGRNVNDNYKETINKLSNKFKDVNKNNWYYYDVIEASVNH